MIRNIRMSCQTYPGTKFGNIDEIKSNFQITSCPFLDKATHCYGWYREDSYEGDSYVLFESEGKWYEVGASHCSCYGLEGQWEPTETTLEAASMRQNEPELIDFINQVKALTEEIK